VGALRGADTGGSDQPVLDQAAVAGYRQRLDSLRGQIEDLESRHDLAAADRARAERDWLIAELAGAAGVAGRARRIPDSAERARIAVGKAIRRALGHVTERDPAIGEHLRATVQTGIRCAYRPG
jgi:hypothetical protein